MRNNKKFNWKRFWRSVAAGVLIIVIIQIIIVVTFEEETYQGMTIDQVIKQRYPDRDCVYIKYGDYYYLKAYESEDSVAYTYDVVHVNEDKEHIYLSGTFAFMRGVKQMTIDIDGFLGQLFIFKHNKTYLVNVIRAIPANNKIIIYDNEGELDKIKHGKVPDFFKAISDIDDYKLYIEVDGVQTCILTEEVIREKCD